VHAKREVAIGEIRARAQILANSWILFCEDNEIKNIKNRS
jgi:hypothetical protein